MAILWQCGASETEPLVVGGREPAVEAKGVHKVGCVPPMASHYGDTGKKKSILR